jgi:aldose 1-epimerase
MPPAPISFLSTGALIQSFTVGGYDIVLGFTSAEPYATAPFFGETIGRVANRIKNGVIDNLNGKAYQLAQNNGPNHLHGGEWGFGRRVFEGPTNVIRDGRESVLFTYTSPDGEEGYPGTIELRVWYFSAEEIEDGVVKTMLTAEYEAELVGDECMETAINITNHRYVFSVLRDLRTERNIVISILVTEPQSRALNAYSQQTNTLKSMRTTSRPP